MTTIATLSTWDKRFLTLAHHTAGWSKDPSTKVGAVIVRPNKTIVALGFNGFPRFTDDDEKIYLDRPRKLLRTVHAEVNAILTANSPVAGCTLYVAPLMPCANCAAIIIQSGIRRVVAHVPVVNAAWNDSFVEARKMFDEALVSVDVTTEAIP